jgi:Protein of unknown function (DUF2380)
MPGAYAREPCSTDMRRRRVDREPSLGQKSDLASAWACRNVERTVTARDCGRHRLPASGHRALAASLAAALIAFAIQPSEAAEPEVKIAVFAFELDDRSAGRGIVAPDAIDTENLNASTEEARRMLAAAGRYSIVDAGAVADEVAAAGGIQHCNGCEVPLAAKLGADQAMVGVFTRVSRTEYTLQILVRDAQTGDVVANASTGLRMGANYSWPRGVKWLMDNRILPAP